MHPLINYIYICIYVTFAQWQHRTAEWHSVSPGQLTDSFPSFTVPCPPPKRCHCVVCEFRHAAWLFPACGLIDCLASRHLNLPNIIVVVVHPHKHIIVAPTTLTPTHVYLFRTCSPPLDWHTRTRQASLNTHSPRPLQCRSPHVHHQRWLAQCQAHMPW